MSERAFSIELNRKVKVTELPSLFKSGELKNIRDFYCLDPECQVPLTAKAVMSKKQSTQFIIQNHDQPHISTCSEVGNEEHKHRFSLEKKWVNQLQQSNLILTFAAPRTSQKSNINKDNPYPKSLSSSEKVNQRNISSNSSSIKQENKTTRNLDIMVDTFENSIERNEIIKISFPFENRQWPNVKEMRIKNTSGKLSLKNLFCPISEIFPYNEFKIFYGEAYLEEINNTKISIHFIKNNSIHIYTNKQKLLNLPEKDIIQKALLENEPVMIYCQGAIELVHLKGGDEFRIITVTEHIYRSLFFKSLSEELDNL